jgi:DNA-binding MarR family transcriptional regulator
MSYAHMMGTAPDSDLADLFFHVSRQMRQHSAARLAPLGLTPGQARALRTIVRAPQPLRMVDLAARLEIVPRSVTTLVDGLQAAGLVRRTSDPRNRRSTLIEPTEQGRRVRAAISDARRQAADDVLAPLTVGQRETLRELLARLCESPVSRR